MDLNEPLVPGSNTTSLCSHHTEPTFSSHIFGRVDEASASHGGVVRAHRSGVGGAAREREAVSKQPRNFDGHQIRDVDYRAGIKLWQQDARTSGMCCDCSPTQTGDSDKSTFITFIIHSLFSLFCFG